MDNQMVDERQQRRWGTTIAGGCLMVLFLSLCILVAVFIQRTSVERNTSTPVPTRTPAPQILVRQPDDSANVKSEDFSSNIRDWGLYYYDGKLEVINGKLILQSNTKAGVVIGTNAKFFPARGVYYVQADFSTDIDTTYAYGLIFGLNSSLGTFYLFEISPTREGFRLLRYNAGTWHELIPFSHHVFKPYPEANTLSVYFDKGNIELYLNGELASTFSDTAPFQSTEIGVSVGNSGYRLIVDNIFIYNKK